MTADDLSLLGQVASLIAAAQEQAQAAAAHAADVGRSKALFELSHAVAACADDIKRVMQVAYGMCMARVRMCTLMCMACA